jgi:hypothetical protein
LYGSIAIALGLEFQFSEIHIERFNDIRIVLHNLGSVWEEAD